MIERLHLSRKEIYTDGGILLQVPREERDERPEEHNHEERETGNSGRVPDLTIGYRACRCALERLKFENLYSSRMQVIVENKTSALDAEQMLIGCTVGNRRLQIYDYGKHVYTFVHADKQGLRLALKPSALSYDVDFLELEQKVSAGMASLSETAQYWALLDRHVRTLLNLSDEDLFNVRQVVTEPQPVYESSLMFRCGNCGELVAASRLITIGRERVCMACAG